MFYKLLGILVWNGLKWSLRHRYGALMARKPVLVGGVAMVIAGVLLAVRGRSGGD